MRSWLAQFVGIDRGEALPTLLFFFFFTTIGMFYTVGATVGDTLFISRLPPSKVPSVLPWVYVGIGVSTVLLGALYEVLHARLTRIQLIVGAHVFLALSMVLFRQAIELDHPAVYFALVVWLEGCAILLITLFFSFAGDYFTTRAARRLYGFVGGGMALGTLVAGLLLSRIVPIVGTRALIYGCAILLLLGASLAVLIRWRLSPVHETSLLSGVIDAEQIPLRAVFSRPYVRTIVLVVTFAVIMSVSVDYQMKLVASAKPEEELAQFFGRFYAAVGVAQVVFQFVFVRRLLNRLGVIPSLMLLPGLLVLGSGAVYGAIGAGVRALALLPYSAAVNFSRLVTAETIDRSARELLFLPLAPRIRVRAQAVVGNIVVTASQALGGLLLLAMSLSSFGVELISIGVTLLGAALLFALYFLRPGYVRALSESLRTYEIDSTDLGAVLASQSAGDMTNRLLDSDDPNVVEQTLELLGDQISRRLVPRLEALTRSPHRGVAVQALKRLSACGRPESLPAIRDAFDSEHAVVREAAVEAYCRIRREAALEDVAPLLTTDDARIRRGAMLGLGRYGGDEGFEAVLPVLERMARSEFVMERMEGAELLGRIGHQAGVPLVRLLLADRASAVRAAAAAASARLSSPELARELLGMLADSELRPQVLRALGAFPQDAAEPLLERITDPTCDTTDRCALISVASKVGGPNVQRVLWALAEGASNLLVRRVAADGLRACPGAAGGGDLPGLDAVVDGVVDRLTLLAQAFREVGAGTGLAVHVYLDRGRLYAELLLSLSAIRHGLEDVDRLRHNLFSDAAPLRASALELLEQMLPRDARDRFIPILQPWVELPRDTGTGLSERTSIALIEADPWLRAVTNQEQRGSSGEGPRELDAEERRLRRLVPLVSILKAVPLFQELSTDYLVEQAALTEEVHLAAGEVLFRKGDPGDALYIVCEGKVRILIGGREISVLERNECLGELALLDGSPRSADAVAGTDVRLLRTPASEFMRLLTTQPSVALALLRTLDRRIRRIQSTRASQGRAASTRSLPPEPKSGLLELSALLSNLALLQGVKLFENLPGPALATLAGLVERVNAYEGETLFEEGDVGDALYLITSGSVAVIVGTTEVACLGANACLGEMALVSGLPRSATARICEETRLLRLGADAFHAALATAPEIAIGLIRTMADRLRRAS